MSQVAQKSPHYNQSPVFLFRPNRNSNALYADHCGRWSRRLSVCRTRGYAAQTLLGVESGELCRSTVVPTPSTNSMRTSPNYSGRSVKQESKGIWRRLHRMTPRTRHAAYTARSAADLSRVTDWQTDTANIGNNSLLLMHSMQPKRRRSDRHWLQLP